MSDKNIPMIHFPVFQAPVWFSDNSFNEKRGKYKHNAVDIFSYRGSPVIAPTNGHIPDKVKIFSQGKRVTVPGLGYLPRGGFYIFIKNGLWQFYFAHLDFIAKGIKIGSKFDSSIVIIGGVGNTGNAIRTKPHLHFQVKYRGRYIDPATKLNELLKLEGRKKTRLKY